MEEAARIQRGFDPSHVARLEEAATILMSPSSNIAQEARKAAEELFINLRNEKLSPEYCRLVIETTSNEFVVFEMVQILAMNLLKQWSLVESSLIRQCFEYILENAVHKFRASKLIRGEMLRACAKLLKRSVFDDKACNADTLDTTIHFLLANDDPQLQAIGCEFTEAIAIEFSTSWGASNLGITFDFHLRARRSFEDGGLRRLFEKCIQTLSELVLTADLTSPYYLGLCENFLRVAEIVLSWNFEIHRFPIRITFANESTPAAALRPPSSWKEIFQSEDFLRLFFELHKRVRHIDTLRVHSMNCLIQLSSLMGNVLMDQSPLDADGPGTSDTIVSAYDRYICNFVAGFVDLFGGGPTEGEVLGLCLIVYKLLTYHRIFSFARAETSFSNFMVFLARFTEHFTPIAMKKALEEDDYAYVDGLNRLYEGWWVILRHSEEINATMKDGVNFEELTLTIVSAFMRTIFSEPLGNRVKIPLRECDNENEEDDRELFRELLDHIGRFSCCYCEHMLPRMFSVLNDKLNQFLSFMQSGVSNEALNAWREDMHWTLLLTGYMLTAGDEDGGCQLLTEVLDYYAKRMQEESISLDLLAPYIKACIDSPDKIINPEGTNSLIKIVGSVLSWCSVEHTLLIEHGAEAVSPELARTSVWCMKRLIWAVGAHVMSHEDDDLATIVRSFSQIVVDFTLQKSFSILNKLSGEEKLCVDAVELLEGLVRVQFNETAKSAFLLPCLSTIQIERLPVRRSLVKVLVQIGANATDDKLQKTLCEVLLQPLRNRFISLCMDSASRETDIVDLIDCFCGVANAACIDYTHFLFEYMCPVLTNSVGLLSSHKESQLITNAVLELFSAVTGKMGVYSEDRSDMSFLHEALLELVRAYQCGQFTRYKVTDVDVEEKATDLIQLLDILGNVMSKDFLTIGPLAEEPEFAKSGAHVAFIALEMLLPVMEDDLLKLPTLSKKFYRFILYFTEMAPECVEMLPEAVFISIIECLRHGLKSDFGPEVAMASAETVTEMASFFARRMPRNEAAIARLSTLIQPTFAMCLSVSWQVDMESVSATALFSLICCAQAAFGEYVKQLLARDENKPYQTVLQAAFQDLLPDHLQLLLGRSEKRDFRNRLEKFLNQVQGILVVE